MHRFHFSRHVLGAATITILSGCASAEPPTPAAVKLQTRLAAGSPPVAVASAQASVSHPPATLPDPGPPGDPSAAQAALGDPNVVAKLRDLALQFSSLAGVSSPMTMHTVAADHQVAEKIISGDLVYGHAPVYVIKITGGPFTASRHPNGVAAPHGNFLTLTVDAATYRLTDTFYSDVEPDLTKIGVAVNL